MDAGVRSGLVYIVRDFLVAHQDLRRFFASLRDGSLRFDEVETLVGDSERSVLFRIKERCHQLFREHRAEADAVVRREALFDLAIGSLFHEAMKLRENFYQQEIYGPRVESLRDEAGEEARELFAEFERILRGAGVRLGEALAETEALLELTVRQFRLLLIGYRNNGLIARALIEQRELVDAVFPEGLDALLADIHGEAADGYVVAARSYLKSSSFSRALPALAEARKRYEQREDLKRLSSYATGMQAFFDGRYEASLEALAEWVAAGPDESEQRHVALAVNALSRVGKLVSGAAADRLGSEARELLTRLEPLAPARAASA